MLDFSTGAGFTTPNMAAALFAPSAAAAAAIATATTPNIETLLMVKKKW